MHNTLTNRGRYKIKWATSGDGSGLLHYALPHQQVQQKVAAATYLFILRTDFATRPQHRRWQPAVYASMAFLTETNVSQEKKDPSRTRCCDKMSTAGCLILRQ